MNGLIKVFRNGLILIFLAISFNWFVFRLPILFGKIDFTLYYIGRLDPCTPFGCEDVAVYIRKVLGFRSFLSLPSDAAPVGVWFEHFLKYFYIMVTFRFVKYDVPHYSYILKILSYVTITLFIFGTSFIFSIVVGTRLGINALFDEKRWGFRKVFPFLAIFTVPIFLVAVFVKIVYRAVMETPLSGLSISIIPIQNPFVLIISMLPNFLIYTILLAIPHIGVWAVFMRDSLRRLLKYYNYVRSGSELPDNKIVFRSFSLETYMAIIFIAIFWGNIIFAENTFSIPGMWVIFFLEFHLEKVYGMEVIFYITVIQIVLTKIILEISDILLDLNIVIRR